VEDALVVYVTDKQPLRRFRPGAKADRFLTLALLIPALLFILKSAWKLTLCWPATQWTDEVRIVPAATIGLACLLIGLALAIWLRRESAGTTWFVEQPSYRTDDLADALEEKAETPAA
jgi:hypothetical protein